MKRMPLWWRRMMAALAPRRSLKIVEGDMLPAKLPRWNLVLARDGGEDWAVGLWCPCGCGQRLEMMLLKEIKPRWDIGGDDGIRGVFGGVMHQVPAHGRRDGAMVKISMRQ